MTTKQRAALRSMGAMMEPIVLPEMISDEKIAEIRASKDWAPRGNKGQRPNHNILGGVGLSKLRMQDLNQQDADMYELWKETETDVEMYMMDDAEYVLTGYGTSARIAKSVVKILRAEGIKAGLIRPKKLFPFPEKAFDELDYNRVKGILGVEMSIPAQYTEDVKNVVRGRAPIATSLRSGGEIVERNDVLAAARKLCGAK